MHVGTQAGHLGYKRTLAKLRQRYVWGSMATDVQRVLRVCIQCWRQNKDRGRNIPTRNLPRGWPGEVVAMDLFGPLPKTKEGNVFILVLIGHFSRWVELVPDVR